MAQIFSLKEEAKASALWSRNVVGDLRREREVWNNHCEDVIGG